MSENSTEILGYEVVKDRFNKKHRVYSVLVIEAPILTKFMQTYNPDFLFLRFIQPLLDEDGIPMRDSNGDIEYDNTPVDEILDVVEMALGGREKREDIIKWLDLDLINDIIARFVRLSQQKKKLTQEKMS